MEGYRSRKLHRYKAHGAARRAALVRSPSPRRSVAKRRKGLSSSARKRRDIRALSPLAWGDEDGPFELPFEGGAERVRVKRERSPPRYPTPDPDDDPAPANIRAALPRSLFRHERKNYDHESTSSLTGGAALWTVPVSSMVLLPLGPGYSERATSFIRVTRLAFKFTVATQAEGSAYQFAIAPYPDAFSNVYNAVYFRFAVIYDKQCDGVNPTTTYPDVFATGPAMAINQFRLPALAQRFDVLHDRTYRWENGNLTSAEVEVVPPVMEPFWVQNGMLGKEEIFIDCDKVVHFASALGTVADISSGNIFYMMCCSGDDPTVSITARMTYSDNL